MPTPHAWTLEGHSCPQFGDYESWHCPRCGLAGGVRFMGTDTAPRMKPFILGKGSPVAFSQDDCDEAIAQLAALRASSEWQASERGRRVEEALWLLRRLSPRVGGNVQRGTVTVSGGDGRRKFRVDLLGVEGLWRLSFKGTETTEEHESIHQVADRLVAFYQLPTR